MKPLNVIQIGKKYTDETKTFKCYQNRVARKSATLSKSRTQISATVLFRKNKRSHFFFLNGTAQLITAAHKRRETNKVRGAVS